MTFTDYLFDSLLVALVLLQVRERPLTNHALIRPLIIVGAAVATYLHGIPTAGNDLILVGGLTLLGATIGILSGRTVIMRPGPRGAALARAGWLSGFFWVAGMGSRFAFAIWANNGGQSALGRFSVIHQITGAQAWTAALLAMVVAEVLGRTVVLASRRARLTQAAPVLA
jgi:hypothetical protein